MTHKLLVSIHDVTPALEEHVRALWTLCRRSDVTPALFVVPDWHGAWPIERHRQFLDWLRGRVRDGADIVLHGERHDEVGSPRSWSDWVRAVGRTACEGEFLTLSHAAATERIARGCMRLRAQGFDPIGFVPPAWLSHESTHDVVREAGLHFSEDATRVHVHARRERLDAPTLRWSGRSTARAIVSRALASARWRHWYAKPLVRLALHPQDLAHPTTAASVRQELERWTAARRPIQYHAL